MSRSPALSCVLLSSRHVARGVWQDLAAVLTETEEATRRLDAAQKTAQAAIATAREAQKISAEKPPQKSPPLPSPPSPPSSKADIAAAEDEAARNLSLYGTPFSPGGGGAAPPELARPPCPRNNEQDMTVVIQKKCKKIMLK